MEKKQKQPWSNRRFGGVWGGVMALIAIILVVATIVTNYFAPIITRYFGQSMTEVVETDSATAENTTYYESNYGEDEGEQLQEDSYAVAKAIADEGIVFLENEDSALPLTDGVNVSLFSVGSVNPILGGTGSGSTSSDVTTIDVFTASGLNVNETLYNFYLDKYENEGYTRTYHGVWSGDNWAISTTTAMRSPI